MSTTKQEKVVLIADHKHAGKHCAEGETIEVDEHEKAFLIRHKKIAGTAEKQSSTGTPKE